MLEDLETSFVWKSQQTALKLFGEGRVHIREMRKQEMQWVGGGQEMLPWRPRALLLPRL